MNLGINASPQQKPLQSVTVLAQHRVKVKDLPDIGSPLWQFYARHSSQLSVEISRIGDATLRDVRDFTEHVSRDHRLNSIEAGVVCENLASISTHQTMVTQKP